MSNTKREDITMHIGRIFEELHPRFFRSNSNIEITPNVYDGGYKIEWSDVFDGQIDVKYSFNRYAYVGAVAVNIKGHSEICLFVDGVKIASCGTEVIPVNMGGEELVIQLRGDLCDIYIDTPEIFGFFPDDDAPLFIPSAKSISLGNGKIKIGSIFGAGEDGAFAANFLLDSLSERYGFVPTEGGAPVTLVVCDDYETEQYSVDIGGEEIAVVGGSRLALLWGACRIIELLNGGELPEIRIDDRPDVPMRGFHMGLPRRDRIDFAKRLFRYVLLPLGYNHVILEFNGAMKFDRHPEIGEKWLEAHKLWQEGKQARIQHGDMGADGTLLEKEEVRDLISVLEDYGIEVIPEVQSFGHVQYLTYAHPEIAEEPPKTEKEVDEREQDALPVNFCAHAYCPSREDSMRYIKDIIDEIVEVARPKRYVHIGHDEIYQVGSCPICAPKGKARVYVDHIMELYNYMKDMGLGIMIWSDMLHETTTPYSRETSKARNMLPKDIMMLDFTWYFDLSTDIEDDILPYGFEVMVGNFYSSHYPRYSTRIAKKNMTGGEVSTWTAVSEEAFANNGKFFDLVYSAEMLWNAYSYDERNRTALNALIGSCILPELRDLVHGRLDMLEKHDIESAEVVGVFNGDTSRIPDEISHLYLTEPVGVMKVGECFDRLVFEHTTLNPAPRIAWKSLYRVGTYTVRYEDGATVEVPVDYAGGILYWKTTYGTPMKQQYYRHLGYVGTWYADPIYEDRTTAGEPILLLGQVWDNPHPEKTIAEISYTAADGDYAVLLSAGVLGIKK